MQAIRYRSGISASTGRVITGRAHLAQSIATIWRTRIGERFMRLPFGANLRSHLAKDVNAALALEIYDDLTGAIIRWEPEYRVVDLQLVSLTRSGGLGLRHGGLYYPEGRFGIRTFVEPFGSLMALADYERLALASAGRSPA